MMHPAADTLSALPQTSCDISELQHTFDPNRFSSVEIKMTSKWDLNKYVLMRSSLQ